MHKRGQKNKKIAQWPFWHRHISVNLGLSLPQGLYSIFSPNVCLFFSTNGFCDLRNVAIGEKFVKIGSQLSKRAIFELKPTKKRANILKSAFAFSYAKLPGLFDH